MSHPLFGPEVRLLLQQNDPEEMKAFCETLHPATAAEALSEDYDVEEVWRILQHTNIRTQAAIFEYFPIEWQVRMVEGTGQQHMAHLIEKMSHDDRVDLLRRLMPRVTESLLRLVDEADRRDIATLVKFKENTAGALVTSDYAWVPDSITVTEAIERMRLQAPDSETIYYVYVLGENRKLLGVVSLRSLILAPRHAIIRDVMEEELVVAPATEDREKLVQDMARYDLLAMPVVDEEGRMVGIVTHDDVIDVVVEEATEAVHRMGAVGPMAENYMEADFFTIWRKRAMWLAVLFGAELFTFTALSYFEDAIAEVVVLGLFVPLCISTGGNSGSQAATLITRALALGQLEVKDWFRVFRHELLMGLVLGLTLGGIGYFRAVLTPESVRRNPITRPEAFQVEVPQDRPLTVHDEGSIDLPAATTQIIHEAEPVEISLPEGLKLLPADNKTRSGSLLYSFPKKCTLRHAPVSRWNLALVIAQAVAAICLWGTLVGSLLPLMFRRLGVDPGIASSPFVATFVDVTGIVIYFTIAKLYLL